MWVGAFGYIQPDWSRLWSNQTLKFAQEVSQQLQQLNIQPAQLKNLFWLSVQTLEMSILAIAIAGVGGFCLAFLAVKQKSGLSQIRAGVSRVMLLFCRGIPAPIWALVILFGMLPGILPGAIALGIHNLGILGRLMTEVIENVEPEPLDALTQLGSPPNLVFSIRHSATNFTELHFLYLLPLGGLFAGNRDRWLGGSRRVGQTAHRATQ